MTERIITLPTFHEHQANIWRKRTKRNALRCGRRFGKTKMIVTMGANASIKGRKVGIFAPEHKQLQEPYDELLKTIFPIRSGSNKTDGYIKTETGGKLDFWSLIDNELAGRGREYDLILIDEAAFTKNRQMLDIWSRSILPTMATRPNAEAWVFSTPNGIDPENFFWKCCNDPEMGFAEFHAPSISNPLVSREWLERERERSHPDVFRQEYLAEFVDWSGTAFFSEDKLLENGEPVPVPNYCDYVFAVLDTALKDGLQHDGTAVIYYAVNKFPEPRVYILDWELLQIQGALLEDWIPAVAHKLEGLAKAASARHGSAGMWIEDKASGIVLIQQAERRGIEANAIDSKLTAQGKEGRALSVSGYVYRGEIKITEPAYNKVAAYQGVTRNHLIAQVCGFRLGQKTPHNMDLLDCFTYGVAIALGDSDGY